MRECDQEFEEKRGHKDLSGRREGYAVARPASAVGDKELSLSGVRFITTGEVVSTADEPSFCGIPVPLVEVRVLVV